MKKNSGIAFIAAVLMAYFLFSAHGQPVTGIYGTDAQREGILGTVRERKKTSTSYLESGQSDCCMTETIRFDERGRRTYYFEDRLDVENWTPTEVSFVYAENSGRVDNSNGAYELLTFDEDGRLMEADSFSPSGTFRGKKVFAYSPSGKLKYVERYNDANTLTKVTAYEEGGDGTVTATSDSVRSVYSASGVLISEDYVRDGKVIQSSAYDELGNPVLFQSRFCRDSLSPEAEDIPTDFRLTEYRILRKDMRGRVIEQEYVYRERAGITWYDAAQRAVAEQAFGNGQITSTRNVYDDNGRIVSTETRESSSDQQSPTVYSEAFVYDGMGRVERKIETDGSGEHTTNYLYRKDGKLGKVVNGPRTEYYAYDVTGSLASKTTVLCDRDASGDDTAFTLYTGIELYSYYDVGKLKTQEDTTIFSMHAGEGDMPDVSETLRCSKEFEYDGEGRYGVEKRINLDGSATTVHYRYDSTGRLENTSAETAASDGGRIYEETDYSYETDNGLLLRTKDQNVIRARIRYAYDDRGNVTSRTEFRVRYDGNACVEVPRSLTTYSYAYYR